MLFMNPYIQIIDEDFIFVSQCSREFMQNEVLANKKRFTVVMLW